MHFRTLLVVAAAVLASASPASRHLDHVTHEKRSGLPAGWAKRSSVKADAVIPLRIGLKQRNLDRAYEFLDSVSNPQSDAYAQHWTPAQVAETFAPSDESVAAVKAWLVDSGIAPSRIGLAKSKLWISINATISEAESLLKTKYNIYQHASTGQPHIACESYSLPRELSEKHVDLILPTVHFDVKLSAEHDNKYKRDIGGAAKSIGKNTGTLPKFGKAISAESIITELEDCDAEIVPDCLRALYTFPPNFLAAEGNSYGIVEYTPQAYVPSDLDMFFGYFAPDLVGQRPVLDSIDGGYPQQIDFSFDYNGESDLDLQYGMTLVYPQTVQLYQVGDLVEGASFNNFLDGIDASYCYYEGGDNPEYDSIYPDPYGGYGAYEGPESCGTFAPTHVISTSYGYNEADLSPAYEMRQCNEYMKLGLQGVTVLYSSGDYGVAGNGGQCIAANGTYNDGGSGRFNPSFPGSCPYVTSVGATEVPPGTNIVESLATGTQPETACETVIYSGGGFSNVFPLPSYQASAVTHYLEAYPPPYTSAQYNNSGKVRAFPDVSANGANYVIAIDGEFGLVYGTSCSSPVFGSIVTLINQERLLVGKAPVGFLNPVLYANPEVMNDITNGTNQGCGTEGFSSEVGWDPVTGLGTPNFVKMLGLFMSLP